MARVKPTAKHSMINMNKKTKQNNMKENQKEVSKKTRYRPGTVALREIRKYQRNTSIVIRKIPFQRLVREIAMFMIADTRFHASALNALQECTEIFIYEVFKDSQLCCFHAKRCTLLKKDMQLAKRIRGDNFFFDH